MIQCTMHLQAMNIILAIDVIGGFKNSSLHAQDVQIPYKIQPYLQSTVHIGLVTLLLIVTGVVLKTRMNTPEYNSVLENMDKIIERLQFTSGNERLKIQFEKKKWADLTAASDGSGLVRLALFNIKLDIANFSIFTEMLQAIGDMDNVVKLLKKSREKQPIAIYYDSSICCLTFLYNGTGPNKACLFSFMVSVTFFYITWCESVLKHALLNITVKKQKREKAEQYSSSDNESDTPLKEQQGSTYRSLGYEDTDSGLRVRQPNKNELSSKQTEQQSSEKTSFSFSLPVGFGTFEIKNLGRRSMIIFIVVAILYVLYNYAYTFLANVGVLQYYKF